MGKQLIREAYVEAETDCSTGPGDEWTFIAGSEERSFDSPTPNHHMLQQGARHAGACTSRRHFANRAPQTPIPKG